MIASRKVVQHAFVDESKRDGSGFMLCAVTVIEGDLGVYRTRLTSLRPKGSARIHMTNAGKDAMRIIEAVARMDAHSRLYVVKKNCKERVARDTAINAAFVDLAASDVTRVVVESCDQDREDKQIIRRVLGPDPALEYVHEPSSMNNPLLWLPDVHAWAWGRGGKFKKAIQHRITEVRLT